MTWSYTFVELLFAHIIADFAVRREILKKNGRVPTQPSYIHLAVFVALSLPLFVSPSPAALVLVLVAAGLHYVIDFSFSRTAMWNTEIESKQRWLFAAQQLIKILLLALVGWGLAEADAYGPTAGIAQVTFVLPYLLGYSIAIFLGDAFVSFVLTALQWDSRAPGKSVEGAGRLIGIFEAILVTTFVIGYQYSAVGLVMAAKSVARFEWLKNDQGKAEYFLIGTLANLTCSVLGGIVALWLAGHPVFFP